MVGILPGISIQRLIPCSHSCTTGKYSVVFGFRLPVRKVADHEFVVVLVRQLAAAPRHLLDALGILRREIVLAGVLALTVSTFQPGFGIGFTAITPSGICTRILMVGEPAQPCGTTNTAL